MWSMNFKLKSSICQTYQLSEKKREQIKVFVNFEFTSVFSLGRNNVWYQLYDNRYMHP